MSSKYYISYNYIDQPFPLPDFDIYQTGRIYCNKNTISPDHYHKNFYELTIVTEGEGKIYTNNQYTCVKKGDIYLSFPHDIHKIIPNEDNPLKYDFCAFYPKNEILQRKLAVLSKYLITSESRVFTSNRIFNAIPLAIYEFTNQDNDFSTNLLNGLFWQIAVDITRIFNNKTKEINVNTNQILCFEIMDYISSNLTNISSLKVVAQKFKYSYNWLSALFKKTTSYTLIGFYNIRRLDYAKDLLLTTNLTLEKIAEKINFSTPYAFSKTFKKHFKISPQQYRKENKTVIQNLIKQQYL